MKNFFIKHKIAFLVTTTLNLITLIQLFFDIINRDQFKIFNWFIYFCLLLYFSFTTKAKPNPKIQAWSLRVDDKLFKILDMIFKPIIIIICAIPDITIKLIITIFKISVFSFICHVFPDSNIIWVILKFIILFHVFGWIVITWIKED